VKDWGGKMARCLSGGWGGVRSELAIMFGELGFQGKVLKKRKKVEKKTSGRLGKGSKFGEI